MPSKYRPNYISYVINSCSFPQCVDILLLKKTECTKIVFELFSIYFPHITHKSLFCLTIMLQVTEFYLHYPPNYLAPAITKIFTLYGLTPSGKLPNTKPDENWLNRSECEYLSGGTPFH